MREMFARFLILVFLPVCSVLYYCSAVIEDRHLVEEISGVLPTYHAASFQVCEVENDLEKTVILLKEALHYNAAHSLATMALARIQLSRGDEIECEQKCADILSSDPFNADAGDTLVQLMLYRELYESAIIHFKQNLERDPHHYSSLAQLIRLLQNAGQIDEAQQYILKSETTPSTSHTNGGLYYCKGLIARYFNNRCEALHMFNHSRADAEWGKPAIYSLIEVYLNTDKGLEDEENLDGTTGTNEEGIKAAWKLLGESRYSFYPSIHEAKLSGHNKRPPSPQTQEESFR